MKDILVLSINIEFFFKVNIIEIIERKLIKFVFIFAN